ncbi:MAG: trigger factor [Candidatus Saccharibacteria bacterium]|nr:trigger factor [Candidatus Saccharibacteria bacterium]
MKIKVKDSTAFQTTLIVSASAKDMAGLKDKVQQNLAKNVRLTGFRTGKVPLHLALRELDDQEVQTAFLQEFIPQLTAQALKMQAIETYKTPQVSVTKFVPYEDLEVELQADHLGETKLMDYTKLSETPPQVSVTEADVETTLRKLKLDFAIKKPANRNSQLGDRLIIDFEGSNKQNLKIKGASAKDFSLILGDYVLLKDFEDQLLDQSAGQKLEFEVRFPKDYQAPSMANKLINFKVEIKQIDEIELPTDKELLKKIGGNFKSLADLKVDIKNSLNIERNRQARSVFEGHLMAKIVKESQIEIPDDLFQAEVTKLQQELAEDLKRNQTSLESWLLEIGQTQDQHQAELNQMASNRLKGGLALREIAKREKIIVTDNEISEAYKHLGSIAKDEDKQKDLKEDLKARLITQKTLERIWQIATTDQSVSN